MISRSIATFALLFAAQSSRAVAQVAHANRMGVSHESLPLQAPADARATRSDIAPQVSSSAPPGKQVVVGALAGVAATALFEGHCEATAKQEKDMRGLAHVLIGVPAVGAGTSSASCLRRCTVRWSDGQACEDSNCERVKDTSLSRL